MDHGAMLVAVTLQSESVHMRQSWSCPMAETTQRLSGGCWNIRKKRLERLRLAFPNPALELLRNYGARIPA